MNILGLLGDLKIIGKCCGPLHQHNSVTADWSGTDNIKSPSHLGKVPNLIAGESELDRWFLCWQQLGKVSSCFRGLSGMWQGSISRNSCHADPWGALILGLGWGRAAQSLQPGAPFPASWAYGTWAAGGCFCTDPLFHSCSSLLTTRAE